MRGIRATLFIALILCLVLALLSCGDGVVETEATESSDNSEVYELQDIYFVTCGYTKKIKGPEMTGENFSFFSEYIIDIVSKCPVDLDSVVLEVLLFDEDAEKIGKYRVVESTDTTANTEFSVKVNINKEEFEAVDYITVKYDGVAKGKVYGYTDFRCNVTFVYNNGDDPNVIDVAKRSLLSAPEIPTKPGYIFNGWYTDRECTEWFSFEDMPITEDTVLYAGYSVDYIEMSSMLMDEAMASVVNIAAKSYTSLLWGSIEISSTTNFGEGVIFAESSEYYYVLTTNTLLEKIKGHEFISYTVEDSYGNVYEATLKHSSEAYDLGVLYFQKGEAILGVSDIAKKNVRVDGGAATTHSSPDGKRYVDFCNVTSYEEFHHKEYSLDHKDIKYEMMIYESTDKENINGRAVYNYDLEIVGIQCGLVIQDGELSGKAHAIPVSLIRKYLDAYGV